MPDEESPPLINLEDVRKFYNLLPRVYEPSDSWHNITRDWVRRFISVQHHRIERLEQCRILNAGSGGEGCTFPEHLVYNLDIAEARLHKNNRSFIGDVHSPPFEDAFFDVSVCVGSVLNYCDAATAISALSRVTKESGYLFIEFETSCSLDLSFTSDFMKPAVLVDTFYNGHSVRLWAYSERYIRSILLANGFAILEESRCHFASPLAYKVTKNSNISAHFSKFDPFISRIPLLRQFCSNVIFFCRKT